MNNTPSLSTKNSTQTPLQDIEHFINKFQKHDAVIITALRDFYKYKLPVLENNKKLYSALFALGYPITDLNHSTYIKDYQDLFHRESKFLFTGSFLVVNRFDESDFIDNMAKLAQYYGQPHIFVIKGGKNPSAYLLGTAKIIPNQKQKSKINTGQIIPFPECYPLIGNPKFFRAYRNRDFYFTGAIKNDSKIGNSDMKGVYQPANWLGRWACSSMGKRVLKGVGILSATPSN